VLVLALLIALLAPAPASAADTVQVRRDVAYGSAPSLIDGRPRTLRLDVYRGRATPRAGARVIVWVHGGGFFGGTRDEMRDYAAYMARRGWLALSVGYRLTTEADLRRRGAGPALNASAQDVQAAIRWVRRHAGAQGADPDRVFAGGFSAGAYAALRVAARAAPGATVSGVVAVAGGGDPAALDRGDPPALLLHGTADRLVAYRRSLETLRAFRRVGIPCSLLTFHGVGHELGATDVPRRIMPPIARWLAAH
jgi:acetyl esterase/lipase